jgi:hypothetical protein
VITDLVKTNYKLAGDMYNHAYSQITNNILMTTNVCKEKGKEIDDIES